MRAGSTTTPGETADGLKIDIDGDAGKLTGLPFAFSMMSLERAVLNCGLYVKGGRLGADTGAACCGMGAAGRSEPGGTFSSVCASDITAKCHSA